MREQIVWVLLGAAIVAAAVLSVWYVRRKRIPAEVPMDEMEGHDFEYYCADILRANGFGHVEVTRGSGDYGIDILAEKDGVSYGVQCKCYEAHVGTHAVAEAYAGHDYYGCMVGAVMTNQYFTAPARHMADRLGILLWDRDSVNAMAAEGEDA